MELAHSKIVIGDIILDEIILQLKGSVPEAVGATVTVLLTATLGLCGYFFKRKFLKNREEEKIPITPEASEILDEAEKLIHDVASGIIRAARPFQYNDPLDINDLYEIWSDESKFSMGKEEFFELFDKLMVQRRLPGFLRKGDDLYIEEDHFAWKAELSVEEKVAIAIKAVTKIESGQTIALDAGSTTVEIAKKLALELKSRNLTKITVVTNSFHVADEILSVAIDLGLPDEHELLTVFMVGGRVRLNTLAIVDDDERVDVEVFHNFDKVLPSLGGADIAFVGTNGITKDTGFTTTDIDEVRSKRSIIENSRKTYIVSDPTKFGVAQTLQFADFCDTIDIITTKVGDRRVLREIETHAEAAGTLIEYVS